jgi:hypothetical protein
MTVVGKILVFLNLIFSLAVGAFAVMSYNASSNHAKGFKELNDRYSVVVATSNSYKSENDQLREQQKTFREVLTKRGIKDVDVKGEQYADQMARKVAAVIDARDSKIKNLTDELKIANDAAKKNDKTVMAATNTSEASTADMQRRQKEVSDLRRANGELAVKYSQQASKLSTEMDLRVQALLKATTLEDQVKSLESNQRDLLRELARMRTSLAGSSSRTPVVGPRPRGTTGSDNPPSESVEGTVKRVDRDLITISVGRDSGLAKGNTLQVFRLGSSPRYIGKIILVEVENKQAVGQVQGKLSTPIRVNDKVASSILGGY